MTHPLFRAASIGLAAAALACRQPDRTPIVETVRLPPLAPITTTIITDSIRQIVPPPRWPADTLVYQLANLDSLPLVIPRCGESAAIASDSVGSVRLGLTYDEVVGRCPGAVALWDLSEKGHAAPVLVVHMRDSRFVLAFDDTLTSSKLTTAWTSDSAARTLLGVGPGMLFSELRRVHGIPSLESTGCTLIATFRGAPGLAFHLDTGRFIPCPDIPIVARDNSVDRLPPTASIRRVVISRPGPNRP